MRVLYWVLVAVASVAPFAPSCSLTSTPDALSFTLLTPKPGTIKTTGYGYAKDKCTGVKPYLVFFDYTNGGEDAVASLFYCDKMPVNDTMFIITIGKINSPPKKWFV